MPLLEAVGMAPTGKNFTVVTAFMCNEQATTYRWVLQQIKHLYVTSAMTNEAGSILNEGEPLVILTDKESGLMPVIDDKFAVRSNAILKNMSSKISHLALKKIWLEIKKAREMVEDPGKIDADISDVHERDMDSEMHDLTSMLEEISMGPISKVREVRRLIKGIICPVLPEDPCPSLTNAPETAVTKGRRKMNSTKRDKSHWEYVSIAHNKIRKSSGSGFGSRSGSGSGSGPSLRGRGRPPRSCRGRGRGRNSGRSNLSSVVNPDAPSTPFPFNNAFPGFMYDFIQNWKNVVGDVNYFYLLFLLPLTAIAERWMPFASNIGAMTISSRCTS
ncbi:hypothetical protein M9H77_34747 [Catharanthus roseus]|uniref:Uncharacterized protein n=1 Tax=Catharanthus roseus TaxID=4058 RepID=A0ACB9ZM16_CATRO|nr:hypothetical protein M9H77_34747 [Catharanthus roseus]